MHGRYEEARQLYEESLGIKRRIFYTEGMVTSLVNLSRVTINLVRSPELDGALLAQSRAYSDEGIALARRIGHPRSLGTLYLSKASVEMQEGRIGAAERTARLEIEAARAVGSMRYEAAGHDLLAQLALERGDNDQARSFGEGRPSPSS
jgi:hypothetical protein